MQAPNQDELRRMALIRRILALPAPHLSQVESALDGLIANTARALTEEDNWIAADQAAQLMGLSPGHLRRLCAQKHLFDGNARLIKSHPGKPTWWLRRSIDPRLIAP